MEQEPKDKAIGQGYKYLGTGLRFGGAIVMFLLGGLALDTWLHTKPLFILVGTFVGAGLGFVSVLREVKADPSNRSTWTGGAGKADGADGANGADE